MKQNYTSILRRTLSAVLLLLLSTLAWADGFMSDGILYTINEDKESVTFEGYRTVEGSQLVRFNKDVSKVVVPSTVVYEGKTYRVTSIGEGAFFDCTSLASISLPDGLTSIGDYAFHGCISLASISLPDGLTSIGEGAFSGCTSLASISLPEGLTSIGKGAFMACGSLTSIEFPVGLTSIGDAAFYACKSLTSISLPAGLTSIGKTAFAFCVHVASIDLPVGLTSIGDAAFGLCLPTTFICRAEDVPVVGKQALDNVILTATLYVPKSSLKAYKAANGWKNFKKIQPLKVSRIAAPSAAAGR